MDTLFTSEQTLPGLWDHTDHWEEHHHWFIVFIVLHFQCDVYNCRLSVRMSSLVLPGIFLDVFSSSALKFPYRRSWLQKADVFCAEAPLNLLRGTFSFSGRTRTRWPEKHRWTEARRVWHGAVKHEDESHDHRPPMTHIWFCALWWIRRYVNVGSCSAVVSLCFLSIWGLWTAHSSHTHFSGFIRAGHDERSRWPSAHRTAGSHASFYALLKHWILWRSVCATEDKNHSLELNYDKNNWDLKKKMKLT